MLAVSSPAYHPDCDALSCKNDIAWGHTTKAEPDAVVMRFSMAHTYPAGLAKA